MNNFKYNEMDVTQMLNYETKVTIIIHLDILFYEKAVIQLY